MSRTTVSNDRSSDTGYHHHAEPAVRRQDRSCSARLHRPNAAQGTRRSQSEELPSTANITALGDTRQLQAIVREPDGVTGTVVHERCSSARQHQPYSARPLSRHTTELEGASSITEAAPLATLVHCGPPSQHTTEFDEGNNTEATAICDTGPTQVTAKGT